MEKRHIMDILRERGFIKQTVYEEDMYALLKKESVPFYIGFDPTADSLHVGHFVALMAMAHMQRAGHKPIVLIGGGTGMVGDPSGRTDMRSFMSTDNVKRNCERFKTQMSKFFSFDGDNGAVMVNNADWLLNLNYLDFLRDIGTHFSVNRMLTAECFKSRMEKGLSFLEFNYMLMQAYDFLVLFEKYGCKLQCGGDDQWSNILAGADLIRRKVCEPAFAMTFSLLTTSDGIKMGKTQKGAVWLDPEKTSPYEFYQYFRNLPDADVEKCLKFLTFVTIEEIEQLTSVEGEKMNLAKERLAFEVTKIVHGEELAIKSEAQAKGAFGGDVDAMPTAKLSSELNSVVDIMIALNLAPSKAEAKRLIIGGGISIDNDKITSFDATITDSQRNNGYIIHKGKKIHIKVKID